MKRALLLIFFVFLGDTAFMAQTCHNPVYLRNDGRFDISALPSAANYRLIALSDSSCNSHLVIKDSADLFLVVPFYETEKAMKPVWLDKSSLVRVSIRHLYGLLTLYNSPGPERMAYQFDIDKEKLFDKSMVVLNCQTGWYKIELKIKGFKHIGWVRAGDLCDNPCSTCN